MKEPLANFLRALADLEESMGCSCNKICKCKPDCRPAVAIAFTIGPVSEKPH